MNNKRSPRFPIVSIEKALEFAQKIHAKVGDNPIIGPDLAETLGSSAMSGKVNKEVAALAAYGLIERVGIEDDKRVFKLTARGVALCQSSGDITEIRLAALSPMPFRRIWFNRPNITQQELHNRLLERGFTEEGAHRASAVYFENVKFADLENAEFRASGLIERPEPGNRKHDRPGRPPGHRGERPERDLPPQQHQRRLVVPLSSGNAVIPSGMTEEEFRMLMQTLRIWREKLIN